MAITRENLLVFNGLESTDGIFGAVQLPYRKPLTFVPNVTYNTQIENLVLGADPRGSQIIVRKLGRGSTTTGKVTASGALKFSHAETADSTRVIPLDDFSKQSEEIFEAVDVARASKTGAQKAEVVFDNIIEDTQVFISGYLSNTATPNTATTLLDEDNIIDAIIDAEQLLDYPADILAVNKATLALLKKTFVKGYFQANAREDVVRTGIVGTVLGYDVVLDYHADYDFVLYSKDHFFAYPLFNYFGIVDARPDFNGSYAQGLTICGGGGELIANTEVGTDAGIWGIKHVGA